MTRNDAVGLLRAWVGATEPAVRTRFEEMILAAMTADRTAAAFAHREELNGAVIEHRAPTLEGLREAVAAFTKPPVLMAPPTLSDDQLADLLAMCERDAAKAGYGTVQVMPNPWFTADIRKHYVPEMADALLADAPAVVEDAARG